MRILKRLARACAGRLHAAVQEPGRVLVLSDGASPDKKRHEVVRRVETVLQRPIGPTMSFKHGKAGLLDILRAAVVVVVDDACVSHVLRKFFSHVFALDFERNPYDGWELARIGSVLIPGPDPTAIRAEARRTLTRRITELRSAPSSCVYLFGTGPSLARAGERSFSDGVVIVCNTIVRDRELWRHLDPEVLVAGDAIYHFGFTDHARTFRRDALARLTEAGSRTLFVYPEVFDRIVRREMGACADRLVPIPIGAHTDISVDLVARYELPGLGNVLNGLLLPLGCSISRVVRLWGFDGRAPDDKLFWSNSTQHAYPELMPSLQEAHPAFYATLVPKGNEASYVKSVHGDDLDRRLTEAEGHGFSFEMMHHSWTATLERRRRSAP